MLVSHIPRKCIIRNRQIVSVHENCAKSPETKQKQAWTKQSLLVFEISEMISIPSSNSPVSCVDGVCSLREMTHRVSVQTLSKTTKIDQNTTQQKQIFHFLTSEMMSISSSNLHKHIPSFRRLQCNSSPCYAAANIPQTTSMSTYSGIIFVC